MGFKIGVSEFNEIKQPMSGMAISEFRISLQTMTPRGTLHSAASAFRRVVYLCCPPTTSCQLNLWLSEFRL